MSLRATGHAKILQNIGIFRQFYVLSYPKPCKNPAKKMAHSTVVLDKRSPQKDGTYPIKLRITHKGEFYINLKISVLESQWREVVDQKDLKSKTGLVINHDLAARYNNFISSRKLEIDKKLLDLADSRKILAMDSAQLKGYITTDDTVPKDYLFKTHYDKYVAGLSRPNTVSSLKYTYSKIGKFCNANTLSFRNMNYEWIKEFDRFMELDGLCVNARGIYMRNIKAVFNDAINCDHISLALYPFRKFRIQKEATQKRSLSIEQLRQLMNCECGETLQKYRDFFMLMFYLRGINTIDLAAIKEVVGGRIQYRRSKTGKLYDIEVLPPAMEIIKRYNGTSSLLSFYDNKTTYRNFSLKANSQIKRVCELLDQKDEQGNIISLFPRISTYWARHTWATIAASLDIPKETIAAALGHGGNEVTDIYIRFDERKIDQANRKVVDHLFEI